MGRRAMWIGAVVLPLMACSAAKSEADRADRADATRDPTGPKAKTEATDATIELPEGVELDGDCIAVDPASARSGPGPSIAGFADLDLEALEALLPTDPRDPELAHTKTTTWRRGDAGHGSPLVVRSVTPDDEAYTSIQITDLVHFCTCRAGLGARRIERAKASGSVIETVAGRSVAIDESGTALGAWAGDRCEISIRTDSKQHARTLAEAIDWAALDALCSERKPKGPLGGTG